MEDKLDEQLQEEILQGKQRKTQIMLQRKYLPVLEEFSDMQGYKFTCFLAESKMKNQYYSFTHKKPVSERQTVECCKIKLGTLYVSVSEFIHCTVNAHLSTAQSCCVS